MLLHLIDRHDANISKWPCLLSGGAVGGGAPGWPCVHSSLKVVLSLVPLLGQNEHGRQGSWGRLDTAQQTSLPQS